MGFSGVIMIELVVAVAPEGPGSIYVLPSTVTNTVLAALPDASLGIAIVALEPPVVAPVPSVVILSMRITF